MEKELNTVTNQKTVVHNVSCWNCGSRTYFYYPHNFELNGEYQIQCTDCNRVIEGERAETMLKESGIIKN